MKLFTNNDIANFKLKKKLIYREQSLMNGFVSGEDVRLQSV